MKEKGRKDEVRPASGEEKISRRAAIKRIAAVLGGAVVGAKLAEEAPRNMQFAYLSNPPHNPYADAVYGSWKPSYYSIKFYGSYKSHYSSVPSPYIPR